MGVRLGREIRTLTDPWPGNGNQYVLIGGGCGRGRHWTDYLGDVESEGSSRTERAGKHDNRDLK